VRPEGQTRIDPLWLVCTNGKRDACCAKDGLPVARALAARLPGRVWECSHLGGHRFAANVLLLPAGLCFGRLRAEDVDNLVDLVARGELPLHLLRGRTVLAPVAQAAEIAARIELDERTLAPLTVTAADGALRVAGLRIELAEEPLAARPISCDAEPEPVSAWRVVSVGPAR
jgi:hypothetical protein